MFVMDELRTEITSMMTHFGQVVDLTRPLHAAVNVRGTKGFSHWRLISRHKATTMIQANVHSMTHIVFSNAYSAEMWDAWRKHSSQCATICRAKVSIDNQTRPEVHALSPWARPCLALDLSYKRDGLEGLLRKSAEKGKKESTTNQVLNMLFQETSDPLITRECLPDTMRPARFREFVKSLQITKAEISEPIERFETILGRLQQKGWIGPKRYMVLLHTGWSQLLPSHPNLGHPIMDGLHRYLINPYLSLETACWLARRTKLAGVATDADNLQFPLADITENYALDYVYKSAKTMMKKPSEFGLPKNPEIRRLPFSELVLLEAGKLLVQNLLLDGLSQGEIFGSSGRSFASNTDPKSAIGIMIGLPMKFVPGAEDAAPLLVRYRRLGIPGIEDENGRDGGGED